MPVSAPKPCAHVGCAALVQGGNRCDEHKRELRKQYDSKRGSSTERGYDGRWRKARLGYLAKHPLCVKHEALGKVVAATVVDHIVPHKGDKVLFWDSANNWQALCKQCHDIKTATEDGGGWGRGA